MSGSTTVTLGDQTFWTYAGSLAILLGTIVRVAEEIPEAGQPPWLAESLHAIRVSAVVTDFGFHIDDDWSGARLDLLRTLVVGAIERLREQPTLARAEAEAWNILDGESLAWRGGDVVSTAASISLGTAILALVDGELPEPPSGTWWFYWDEGPPRTIAMNLGSSSA